MQQPVLRAESVCTTHKQLQANVLMFTSIWTTPLQQTHTTQAAATAMEAWLAAHGRRPGMGGSASGGRWHDEQLRGDITSWANEGELQAAGQPLLAAVLHALAALRCQLAQQG